MRFKAITLAGALLVAGAGGLVLAQEVAPSSPAAGTPPSEGEAPPPMADPALSNAVTPDEAAPPPSEEALAEVETRPATPTPKPAAPAAAANTVAEEEPEPPPPPPPLKRPRFTTAILQAVDKSTGDTLRFEAQIGKLIRYKGLTLSVHACETNAADDDVDDSFAHLEVSSQPQTVAGRAAAPPRQVYRGWMFAHSQSLHPLEHPLYDLWLIACKTEAPPAPGSNL